MTERKIEAEVQEVMDEVTNGDEVEARFVLALERGEVTGDIRVASDEEVERLLRRHWPHRKPVE